jgi:hypothetical protein
MFFQSTHVWDRLSLNGLCPSPMRHSSIGGFSHVQFYYRIGGILPPVHPSYHLGECTLYP